MELLPYELIHMIYDYIYNLRDVINLSLVNNYLHKNVSKEQQRILNIRKLYTNINKSVARIKHYICHKPLYGYRETLRINDNGVVVYRCYSYDHFNNRGYNERNRCQFLAVSTKTIKIWTHHEITEDNNHIQLSTWWIRSYYKKDKKEIYDLLNDRKIVYLCELLT